MLIAPSTHLGLIVTKFGITPQVRVLPVGSALPTISLPWWYPRVPAPTGFVERTLERMAELAHAASKITSPDSAPLQSATPALPDAPNALSASTTLSDSSSDDGDEEEHVKGPYAVEDLSMEDLVREHADAVYRVALSVTRDPMLAEDASQDALIKAWQALPSFRGDAPLRNWVLRITHNTAISLLRKRRDELRDPAQLPDAVSYRTVESQVQNRLAVDRFAVALEDLDSLSRSIVVLREVEGLSYEQICDVLDLPMPTVKTRLLRARRQLATALDGWQP